MSKLDVILLPIQGNPVTTVWLPQSRQLDGLQVRPLYGSQIDRAVKTYGEAQGLTQFRHLGVFTRLGLVAWIAWVQPGEAPKGLQAVPVSEAARLSGIGPIVQDIQRKLAEARR